MPSRARADEAGIGFALVRYSVLVVIAAVLVTMLTTPLLFTDQLKDKWNAAFGTPEERVLQEFELARLPLDTILDMVVASVRKEAEGEKPTYSTRVLGVSIARGYGDDGIVRYMERAEELVNAGDPADADHMYDVLFELVRDSNNSNLKYVLGVRSSIAALFAGNVERATDILLRLPTDTTLLRYLRGESLTRNGTCEDGYSGLQSQYPRTMSVTTMATKATSAMYGELWSERERVEGPLTTVIASAAENADYDVQSMFLSERSNEDEDGGEVTVEVVSKTERYNAMMTVTAALHDVVVDVATGCVFSPDGTLIGLGTMGYHTTATKALCDLSRSELEITHHYEFATSIAPLPYSAHTALITLPARLQLLRKSFLESVYASENVTLLIPDDVRCDAVESIIDSIVGDLSNLHVAWLDEESAQGAFVSNWIVSDWSLQVLTLWEPRSRWYFLEEVPLIENNDTRRWTMNMHQSDCASVLLPPRSVVNDVVHVLRADAAATCLGDGRTQILYLRPPSNRMENDDLFLALVRSIPDVRVRVIENDVHEDLRNFNEIKQAFQCASVVLSRNTQALTYAMYMRPGSAVVELPSNPRSSRSLIPLIADVVGVQYWTVEDAAAGYGQRLIVNRTIALSIAKTVEAALENEAEFNARVLRRSEDNEPTLSGVIEFQDGVTMSMFEELVIQQGTIEFEVLDKFLANARGKVSSETVAVLERAREYGSKLVLSDACTRLSNECGVTGRLENECNEAARSCWRLVLAYTYQVEEQGSEELEYRGDAVWSEATARAASEWEKHNVRAERTWSLLTRRVEEALFKRECIAELESTDVEEVDWTGATPLHCLVQQTQIDPQRVIRMSHSCWEHVLQDSRLSTIERLHGEVVQVIQDYACFCDVTFHLDCPPHVERKIELAEKLDDIIRRYPLSTTMKLVPYLGISSIKVATALFEDLKVNLPFREHVSAQALVIGESFAEAGKFSLSISERFQDNEKRLWQVFALMIAGEMDLAKPFFPALKQLPYYDYDRNSNLNHLTQLGKFMRDRLLLWEEHNTTIDAPTPPPKQKLDRSDRPYFLSLCTVFRDEGIYLEEWLEYHLMLGVEHFFLTQHNSTRDDPWEEVLQPYIDDGIVTLDMAPVKGDRRQVLVCEDCVKHYGNLTDWMVFIDIDEFIVPKIDENLRELLSRYQDSNGLFFAERPMAGYPHFSRPPAGSLVIESYEHPLSTVMHMSPYGKLFLNMRTAPLHLAEFGDQWGGYYHNPLPSEYPLVDEYHRETVDRWYVAPPTRDIVQYNHYQSKSIEDCEAKQKRGYSWYEARFGSIGRSKWEDWPEWAQRKTSKEICEDNFKHAIDVPDGAIERFITPLKARLSAKRAKSSGTAETNTSSEENDAS